MDGDVSPYEKEEESIQASVGSIVEDSFQVFEEVEKVFFGVKEPVLIVPWEKAS